MSIVNCQFEEGSPRPLAVTAEDGRRIQATAELKSAVRYPTHEARHFQLTIDDCRLPIVRVQVNGPSTGSGRADDERRLKEVINDLLIADVPEIVDRPRLPETGGGQESTIVNQEAKG